MKKAIVLCAALLTGSLSLKGSPCGIGICVVCDTQSKGPSTHSVRITDHLTVIPLRGYPPADSGLKSGDEITEIDGNTLAGMKLEDAVDLMTGEPGTTVNIRVRREGVNEPISLTVVRQIPLIRAPDDKTRKESDAILAHP